MLTLLTAAALAASSPHDPASTCDLGSPHPDMPDAFAQFAFLIGDYEVDNRLMTADGWGEPQWTARWNGRYGLDGRAVVDTWYDPGYGVREQSGIGVNLRLYDAAEEVWKMAWHYTADLEVRELHAKLGDDGVLRMWQVYPEAAERRIRFEAYDDGRWARIEQARDEATGDWSDSRMLDARPVACVAAAD